MKRLGIIFAVIILIVLAGIVWLNQRPATKIDFYLTAVNAGSLPKDTEKVVFAPNLEFGKWMIHVDSNNQPSTVAYWLGIPYQGKNLIEPINVIVFDSVSKNSAAATERLLNAVKKTNFFLSKMHSYDYTGLFNKEYIGPIGISSSGFAFSDSFFLTENDHGRIFGPYNYNGVFYFIAGFSREKVDVISTAPYVAHVFVSFNRARDDFAKALAGSGGYKIDKAFDMQNSLQDGYNTTGDHDGKAAVLQAVN